jgi:hypothetical protein
MTTYKEIRGSQIEAVTTDPSNPIEGQVWYNTTSNVLKGQAATGAGSWSSGGNMNTSRYYHAGFGASNDAAFAVSGQTSPGGPNTNTETYNGTSWTEVNNLNTARGRASGAGTTTSGVVFTGTEPDGSGGQTPTAKTELWNGTNWTEVNDVNNPVSAHGSSGASGTSALSFGGSSPAPADSAKTESWNGTNWTEVNNLNNARSFVLGGAMGTQTAGLCGPGYSYNSSAPALNTEIWNGTNWTESGDSSTGGTGRFGLYDSAVKVTGTTVEVWNGTSWSSGTSASNNITSRSGGGTNSSGMVFGGEPPASGNSLTTSEEWIGAGVAQTRTFTDS